MISTILTGDFWNCKFWVVVNPHPIHAVRLLQDLLYSTMSGHLQFVFNSLPLPWTEGPEMMQFILGYVINV